MSAYRWRVELVKLNHATVAQSAGIIMIYMKQCIA